MECITHTCSNFNVGLDKPSEKLWHLYVITYRKKYGTQVLVHVFILGKSCKRKGSIGWSICDLCTFSIKHEMPYIL